MALTLFNRERPATHIARGRLGERVAARFLKRAGYVILTRNAQAGGVEIDLLAIAPDRTTIVVVEVKTRAGRSAAATSAFRGETAVDPEKQRRLARAARAIARRPDAQGRTVRVDIVAVDFPGPRPSVRTAQVRHHVNALAG
jgi:putative endonuclease